MSNVIPASVPVPFPPAIVTHGGKNPHSPAWGLDSITDPELIEILSLDDPTVLDRTRFSENTSQEQRDASAELWVDVKAS